MRCRGELAEEFGVPAVDRRGFRGREGAPGVALGVADDEDTTRTDVAVQPKTVHGDARLRERLLPGEHVGVDGVHEGPVEVEEQGAGVSYDWASRMSTTAVRGCTS
jgi:hypothetical protein